MKENWIKVVICERGTPARVDQVYNRLEELQQLVGGYIEVMPLSGGVVLVCNEEGKIDGSKENRTLKMADGSVLDTIFGTFFLCRTEGEEFAGLGQEEAVAWAKRFRYQVVTV